MPSLRCPQCGHSDLHAVAVEVTTRQGEPEPLPLEHTSANPTMQELACMQCGWTPSKEAHPNSVVGTTSVDPNH